MPVTLIIYLVTALSIFGTGYFTGWQAEHKTVLELQSQIIYENEEMQRQLHTIRQRIAADKTQQQQTIIQLEAKYHETIGTNDNLYKQLTAAQLQHRADSQSRAGCTVSKAGDPRRGQAHGAGKQDVDTDEFSARLDRVVSNNAIKADSLDLDKHFLLNWIDSIPPELVEK